MVGEISETYLLSYFRLSLWSLPFKIERLNNDNTNHNHGRRRRQPLLANVNPRLPKAVH